jgi:hydrogenase maturation protease
MARISVIGIGNVLEGDDAVGPTVVRLFEAAYSLPGDVEVIDGGTPGLDLTAYLADLEALVVIDAMTLAGAAPGTMKVYDKAGILNRGPIIALSPHAPSLRESLLHAQFHGVEPKVVRLVGVVAGAVESGCRLTPAVRAAIPGAVAQVKRELEALGVAVTPRQPPLTADLWWEKPQGP